MMGLFGFGKVKQVEAPFKMPTLGGARVTIQTDRVEISKPRLMGATQTSVRLADIVSVGLETRAIKSEVILETRGGREVRLGPVAAHIAQQAYDLLERLRAGE